jgi:hypothetical protein
MSASGIGSATAHRVFVLGLPCAGATVFGDLQKLARGFQAIHATGATLSQECIAWTSSHFMNEQFGLMYFVPSYNGWL